MKGQPKKRRVWMFCAVGVLLAACVSILLWDPGGQSAAENVKYPSDVLWAEAERIRAELKEQGIRVMAYTAKEQYNAAVVVVHPDDKAKLRVTQRGVPEKRYYRLIREEGRVPVYIEFEGPYSLLPG